MNSPSLPAQASSAFSELQWQTILACRTLENIPMNRLKQSFLEGVPSSLRGRIWSFVTKSASFSNSFSRKAFENAITKVRPKDASMIKKDLFRTYPAILCTDDLRLKLEHVLSAYAACDPEVGYCQGMAFIAAAILIIQQDEFVAFSTFYQIMRDKNWRKVYSIGTPGLLELLEKTYSRIETNMPTLHAHMRQANLDGCLSQYFLTAFLSTLTWEDSLKVLDMFILEGADFLVNLIIKIFQLNQYELLQMDEEELFSCLRSSLVRSSFKNFQPATLLTPPSLDDEFENLVIF